MNIKKKLYKKEIICKREKALTRTSAPMSIGAVRGFTFIEVIVVIAIIGIMTGVALVSMNNARTNKALETAGQEVAATIREAQNYALTGKGAGAGCNLYTFTYTATAPSNSYSVSNGAACSINYSYILKNRVVFLSDGSFSFSAPHGAVGGLSVDPEVIILDKNGKQIRVCVYDSGRVEETAVGENCPL